MRLNRIFIYLPALIMAMNSVACRHDHSRHTSEPGQPEHSGHVEQHDHTTHNHVPADSDLERPVTELLAEMCEHNVPTFTCDECRYEVGVVRVPGDMLEAGLITETTAVPHAFGSDLVLTGEITFDDRLIARLGPREGGFVRQVDVVPGDRVKKGDVLVKFESPSYPGIVSDYLQAASAVELARKSVSWQESLRGRSMTSDRDYQHAISALEDARIRLQSSRMALKAAGLSVSDAKRFTKSRVIMSIRAPFDGEVFQVNAVRGTYIDRDRDVVLMGSQERLWVQTDIHERHIAKLAAGSTSQALPVQISVPAWPGLPFKGELEYAGGFMDRQSRTIKARVTVQNTTDRKLKAGMFARIKPLTIGNKAAVAVPESAVLNDEGRSFVFVKIEEPDIPEGIDRWYIRRPVQTGARSDGLIEITDGLSTGQKIITDGAFLLKSDVLRAKMGEGCAH